MIHSFAVDITDSSFWLRECEPKIYKGEVQLNTKGIPKWSVVLIMRTDEGVGDIRVTIPADTNPCEGINPLTKVRPVNVRIGQWVRGERSGIYFTADAIEKEDESNA